jgi:hypothetical protein
MKWDSMKEGKWSMEVFGTAVTNLEVRPIEN